MKFGVRISNGKKIMYSMGFVDEEGQNGSPAPSKQKPQQPFFMYTHKMLCTYASYPDVQKSILRP